MKNMDTYLKKPLSDKHRVRLFALAGERFRDTALRKIADQALADFMASAKADARSISPREIAVLAKYHHADKFESLTIEGGYETTIRLPGIKVFHDNEGKERTKADVEIFKTPRGPFNDPGGSIWSHVYSQRCYSDVSRNTVLEVPYRKGEEKILVPGKNGVTFKSSDKGILRAEVSYDHKQVYTAWVTNKTLKLCETFVRARAKADQADQDLRNAARELLRQSKKFGEVLSVWPEAAELVEELYPTTPINLPALLTVETKNLLCQNMRARKVKGVESLEACI